MQKRRASIEGWLRHSRALHAAGHGFRWLTAEPSERDSGQFVTEQAILHGEDSPAIIWGWGRVETGLEEIRSVAEAQRSSVGIVVIPFKEQVVRDYPSARYQSRAKDVGNRLGLFVIDPLPRFVDYRAKAGSLFIPYDRHHPSANGHSLIGEVVADYLQQQEGLLGSGRRTD
jgi:hypothetical protein